MSRFSEWVLAKKGVSLDEKKLTTAERDKLPKSDFVYPEKEGYPIEDKEHARNALSRVSQFGSPSEKSEVRAKVHKKYPEIGKKDEE